MKMKKLLSSVAAASLFANVAVAGTIALPSGTYDTIEDNGGANHATAVAPLNAGAITGTAWSSGTAGNTTQNIINANEYAGAYLLQLDTTTTITTGAITIQVSGDGGANWVTANAYQVVDPTSLTGATIAQPYTLAANTQKQFLIYPQGMAVRLQLSTAITGTGTLTPYVTPMPLTHAVAQLPSANAYPSGAVPITASATGTTAATTATLTNVTGHTTYICGFSIRANATAAATGNATITGTITGTLNFTQWTAPLASGLGITENTFTPCVPASAVSTSIAVISAAPGTGGVVSVTAWGFSI